MKKILTLMLLSGLVIGCHTPKPQRNDKPMVGMEIYAGGSVEVVCEPAYYKRSGDGYLVPARNTDGDFQAEGVMLKVVEPQRLAGSIVTFHFDLPELWNYWYKPGHLYRGRVATNYIGRLAFMCDSGWPDANTNGVLKAAPKRTEESVR